MANGDVTVTGNLNIDGQWEFDTGTVINNGVSCRTRSGSELAGPGLGSYVNVNLLGSPNADHNQPLYRNHHLTASNHGHTYSILYHASNPNNPDNRGGQIFSLGYQGAMVNGAPIATLQVSNTEPTYPIGFWFNPSNGELKIYTE